MSVVIYLSNQDVRAVVGTGKGGSQVSVSRVFRAEAPEGSIINGLVTNEEAFDAFLREFWENSQLPGKRSHPGSGQRPGGHAPASCAEDVP